MAYAIVTGIATREEVLAFYGCLFNGQEVDKDSDLWGLLAWLVCELYPEELMDTITRAFEDGLIHPGMISKTKKFQKEEEKNVKGLEKEKSSLASLVADERSLNEGTRNRVMI